MNSRRHAFMLAGALTATVFTAAAAFAGIAHRPTQQVAAATPIVQVAPGQAPVPHEVDD